MIKLTYKPAISVVFGFVCFVLVWIFWPVLKKDLSFALKSTPSSETKSIQPSTRTATSPIGQVKAIRVSDTRLRHDLPVFTTKGAVIRYLLAFNREDIEALTIILANETFPVADYTPVQIVDFDPIGTGLYQVKILSGPKQSRLAWVQNFDLRDR